MGANGNDEMNSGDSDQINAPPSGKKVGFFAMVLSTLAAAIGVQTEANRHRDFKHGRFGAFIIAGLVFTAVFITVIAVVVGVVLPD